MPRNGPRWTPIRMRIFRLEGLRDRRGSSSAAWIFGPCARGRFEVWEVNTASDRASALRAREPGPHRDRPPRLRGSGHGASRPRPHRPGDPVSIAETFAQASFGGHGADDAVSTSDAGCPASGSLPSGCTGLPGRRSVQRTTTRPFLARRPQDTPFICARSLCEIGLLSGPP